MSVPFRFDTVLRVREAERDRCRQALALEQQRESALIAEQSRLSAEREAVLDEMKSAQQNQGISADQHLSRRQYAERLTGEISRVSKEIQEVVTVIGRCRDELLEADTSVKALEKLSGRQAADQQRVDQAGFEREREETWRGGRVA